MKVNYLIIFLATLTFCNVKQQKERMENVNTKVNEIVLVDAGTIDRCMMGKLIQDISQCNPKVVGVNFFFIGNKSIECDSILKQSIADSHKVILIEALQKDSLSTNQKIMISDENFSEVALSTGIIGLVESDGVVNGYYECVGDQEQTWQISFPFQLALEYDSNRRKELSRTLDPLYHPISILHSKNSFLVLNYNQILSNKSLIKDRIVIIGYLGSGNEDLYVTRSKDSFTESNFGTVIIANVVLENLKDF